MPFVSASAISPYNDIRGGAEGGVTGTLLLDLYPGASAAYSLRQLRTAYEGPAIKVRREVDGALLNIGFVDGDLDTASLLAFAAGTNGYASVATWYDQSGDSPGTRNFTQVAASKMPQIVVNNVLVVDSSGNPAFSSENVSGFNFQTPSVNLFPASTDAYSLFTTNVMSSDTSSQYFSLYGTTAPYPFRWPKAGTNSRVQNYATDGSFSLPLIGIETNTHYVQSFIRTPSTAQVFANSVGGAELTGLNPPVTDQSNILYYSFSSLSLKAKTQEFIIYPSNQSANRRAIETNANNYWSIYPTALDFNPYNVWDSEHISINNTITTLTDFNTFGDTYDLVNPAASNQPAYTSSDTAFRELPSLAFDGTGDYVLGNAPNFRSSDTSGMFISVYRLNNTTNLNPIVVSSSSTNNYVGFSVVSSNTYRFIAVSGPSRSWRGSTNINNTTTSYVVANVNTGSSYKQWINEDLQTITMLGSGANDGSIWTDAEAFNNIAIGALVRQGAASNFSGIRWAFSGYFPYVDDETTLSLMTALKNKYIDAPIPVDPILAFNPTNVWDSEHIIIDGDETTFVDFNNSGGGSYNLINPTATNQPSFNQSSSNFNNLPSFTFDGNAAAPDYVTASVSNFRGSDSSGVVINVVRIVGSNLIAGLGSYNTASSFNYVGYSLANVGNKVRIINAAPSAATANLRIYIGSTDVLAGSPPFAFANVSTGSEYKIFVDNAEDTVSMTNSPAGNDGAIWFNDGTQDNITIGVRNSSTIAGQGNIEWCFSGYFPYESDSQVQGIMDYLVTKYNL